VAQRATILYLYYSPKLNSALASNSTSLPIITPPVSNAWLNDTPYFSRSILPSTTNPVTVSPFNGFLLTPLNSKSNVSSCVVPAIVKSLVTESSLIDLYSKVIFGFSSALKKSADFKCASRLVLLVLIVCDLFFILVFIVNKLFTY